MDEFGRCSLKSVTSAIILTAVFDFAVCVDIKCDIFFIFFSYLAFIASAAEISYKAELLCVF